MPSGLPGPALRHQPSGRPIGAAQAVLKGPDQKSSTLKENSTLQRYPYGLYSHIECRGPRNEDRAVDRDDSQAEKEKEVAELDGSDSECSSIDSGSVCEIYEKSNDKSSKGASNASKVRSKTLTQKLKSVVRSNESEESRQQRKKDYKDLKLGSRVVFGMAGGPQANA